MTKWIQTQLGKIANVTMGQSPKSKYYNSIGEGLPFLQGNRTFGDKYPIFDTYTTNPTKTANAQDIIMSVRAPVGDLNITPTKICLGRGVCSIRMKNNNQEFLYYLMRYYIKDLLNRESGTVFGSVNKNDISGLVVNVPECSEIQNKIASVLFNLDNKIELNNKINNNLEQQAQALFKSWFVDFEPFGGKMPDDWKVGKLGEITEITMGQSPNGSSYNEEKNGCIFFQGRAEFGTRFPKVRLYTTEPKRMAKKGDVLVSVRAPVGDFNVAIDNCCIGRGLCAIRSKQNCQSFILYTIWASQDKLNIFNGEGTVFGSVNKDSLYNMPVVIPTNKIMQKFEYTCSALDKLIWNNSLENTRLAQLRDTLLPKLMSGEIDVSKVNISADKLSFTEK